MWFWIRCVFGTELIDVTSNDGRVNMIALRLTRVFDWHEIVERSVAKLMLDLTKDIISIDVINAPLNTPLSSISPSIQNGWTLLKDIIPNNCLTLNGMALGMCSRASSVAARGETLVIALNLRPVLEVVNHLFHFDPRYY